MERMWGGEDDPFRDIGGPFWFSSMSNRVPGGREEFFNQKEKVAEGGSQGPRGGSATSCLTKKKR